MTLTEMAQLLTFAAAVDSRKVTDPMVLVWHQIIGDLDYGVACVALQEHRRNCPGVYLEPGHILSQVKIAVAKRRELHGFHPKAPAGLTWAVDVPDLAVEA